MSRVLDRFFEVFDPEEINFSPRKNLRATLAIWRQGLWLLLFTSWTVFSFMRIFINPNKVQFPEAAAGMVDYESMIMMSALLIALDAMLIVLISWKELKRWQDVLFVATCVGLTHVVYPLFTFGLTAGIYYLAGQGYIPEFTAHGAVTAIFFTAWMFVAKHLREVNEGIRKPEADPFNLNVTAWTFRGVVAIFPAVQSVSNDALMVGPAKLAFVERYSTDQFLMSFVWIGAGVFVLVLLAGLLVMALNRWIANDERIARKIQRIDHLFSVALLVIFVHFNVFAACYFMFTFLQAPLILETGWIWGVTFVIAFGLLRFTNLFSEVKEASMKRTGLAQVEGEDGRKAVEG